jgi:hypothetical protein
MNMFPYVTPTGLKWTRKKSIHHGIKVLNPEVNYFCVNFESYDIHCLDSDINRYKDEIVPGLS